MSGAVTLLAGPTASGKSALALRLAERQKAIIINADAMQVYADLSILTARPSAADEARVPHHLYGMVAADAHWSVGAWVRTVTPLLATPQPKIIVGGTGLYFLALTHGLADIPEIDLRHRAQAEQMFDQAGEAAIRQHLRTIDPQAEARILPHDRMRLVRALSVHAATGVALSDWQAATQPLLPPGQWRGLVLAPPRDVVVDRITQRWQVMLDAGVLDEVAPLLHRPLPTTATIRTAHGLPHLLDHLRGAMTLEQAASLTVRDTRRYAKRQMSWARRYMHDWQWLENPGDIG